MRNRKEIEQLKQDIQDLREELSKTIQENYAINRRSLSKLRWEIENPPAFKLKEKISDYTIIDILLNYPCMKSPYVTCGYDYEVFDNKKLIKLKLTEDFLKDLKTSSQTQ